MQFNYTVKFNKNLHQRNMHHSVVISSNNGEKSVISPEENCCQAGSGNEA